MCVFIQLLVCVVLVFAGAWFFNEVMRGGG